MAASRGLLEDISPRAEDVNANFNGLAVKLTDLFGMADVFTITLVVPIFSGLWPFVTTKGCVAGLFAGVFYVVLWGWVEIGTFVAGFSNLTLMCFGVEGVAPKGYSPYGCGPWCPADVSGRFAPLSRNMGAALGRCA